MTVDYDFLIKWLLILEFITVLVFAILIFRSVRKRREYRRLQREPLPFLPPCAFWHVWKGREIEGTIDRGEWTLFVRVLVPDVAFLSHIQDTHPELNRVWFCAEFRNWSIVRESFGLFDKVCIEVLSHDADSMPPEDIAQHARIYLKVKWDLKDGDHVCVGSSFKDESFDIGNGEPVAPQAYTKDIQIL